MAKKFKRRSLVYVGILLLVAYEGYVKNRDSNNAARATGVSYALATQMRDTELVVLGVDTNVTDRSMDSNASAELVTTYIGEFTDGRGMTLRSDTTPPNGTVVYYDIPGYTDGCESRFFLPDGQSTVKREVVIVEHVAGCTRMSDGAPLNPKPFAVFNVRLHQDATGR